MVPTMEAVVTCVCRHQKALNVIVLLESKSMMMAGHVHNVSYMCVGGKWYKLSVCSVTYLCLCGRSYLCLCGTSYLCEVYNNLCDGGGCVHVAKLLGCVLGGV